MKFKCKLSGVVIEFTQEQDIKTTLDNPAYEQVVDVPAPVVKEEKPKKEVKVEPKE